MSFRIARIEHQCDNCGGLVKAGTRFFSDANRKLCEKHGIMYLNGELTKVRKSQRYININTRVGIDKCSKCSDVSTHTVDGKLVCNEHIGDIIYD